MKDIVGLIPAAGLAKRLAPLPSSKELFPVGFMEIEVEGRMERRPKPVALYAMERMVAAGAERILLTLSREKTDILRYFGGSIEGAQIAYLVQDNMWGMPYALNLAYPWLKDETVMFGMPDTVFYPDDAFKKLLDCHKDNKADLTLGLFPTDKPDRFGMVSFDDALRMLYTIDKPRETDLKFMWGIGCWGSRFTSFMYNRILELTPSKETVLGDIFQAAVDSGMDVRVLPFESGEYVDIGTSDELEKCVQRFSA